MELMVKKDKWIYISPVQTVRSPVKQVLNRSCLVVGLVRNGLMSVRDICVAIQ